MLSGAAVAHQDRAELEAPRLLRCRWWDSIGGGVLGPSIHERLLLPRIALGSKACRCQGEQGEKEQLGQEETSIAGGSAAEEDGMGEAVGKKRLSMKTPLGRPLCREVLVERRC